MTPTPLPRPLIEAARKNQLVLFVGAGLSYSLKNKQGEELGGWSTLVEKLINNLKEDNPSVELLEPLVPEYEPIHILNLIELNKGFSKTKTVDFLKEYYRLDKEENDFGLHKKLYQLSKKIVTTNYDRAFEIAEEDLEGNTAFKGKNYELTKHRDPESPLLFKLHGCANDGDSMVLLPSHYRDLYENQDIYVNSDKDVVHSLLTLKNIILNKTILFIGCGMGDYQINSIFKELDKIQRGHGQPHFIITQKEDWKKDLDFIKPVFIEGFKEITGVVESLLNEKDKHLSSANLEEAKKIKEQSEQLEKSRLRIGQLEEEQSQERNEVKKSKIRFEQNGIKYFSKGLEFHMNNQLEKAIESYEVAIDFDSENPDTYNNLGVALSSLGKMEEKGSWIEASLEKYCKAADLDSEDSGIYYNWGTALSDLGKIEGKSSWMEASLEKYSKATDLNPKDSGIYYNWGNALFGLGEMEGKSSWIEASLEKYSKATDLNPKDSDTYNNWGIALSSLGEIEGKPSWIEASLEKYSKATDLNPEHPAAYNNWGIALFRLGKIEGKLSWIEASLEKYSKATDLNPEHSAAYNNWGAALFRLGKIEGKSSWIEVSLEKYSKATDLNPEYSDAYNNWGAALMYLGEKEEDENILNEAFEKLTKAHGLGSSLYNLSCWHAIKKQKQKALELLKEVLENKEVSTQDIQQDEDWKHYWQDPDFKALLAKYED